MKELSIKLFIVFTGFLFGGIILTQTVTKTVLAQENEQEKCRKLLVYVEEFNKECQDINFRDSFSPQLVSKFGIVPHELEMAELDSLKNQLFTESDLYGFVVIYGGRINKYGEIAEREKRIKSYLSSFLKIEEKNYFY